MMPKQEIELLTDFGRRLTSLRKKAGYTQVELAKELDDTQRMIFYHEGQSEYPPAFRLHKLARLLNVSADELLDTREVGSLSHRYAEKAHSMKMRYGSRASAAGMIESEQDTARDIYQRNKQGEIS